MATYSYFHAVGNHLARDQAHAHASVVHGGAIGHGNRVHHDGYATTLCYTQAHAVCLRAQRFGTGCIVSGGSNDGDHRAVQIIIVQARGTQKGSVWCAGHALGHCF